MLYDLYAVELCCYEDMKTDDGGMRKETIAIASWFLYT